METSVTFEKVVGEGKTLGRWNGKALFCVGPLPGETATVRITRERSNWAEATMIAVTDPSLRRKGTPEGHFLACSPWQSVDYDYQLELKGALLADAFGRPELTLATAGMTGSPEILRYRNKLEFGLTPDNGGRLQLAFHNRGDYRALVAAPNGCVLGTDSINFAALTLINTINTFDNLPRFDSVVVRSDRLGGCLAVLMLAPDGPATGRKRLDGAMSEVDLSACGLTGLAVARRTRHDASDVLWSAGRLELGEDLGGVRVSYPWDGFFQVNPAAFEPALAQITTAVAPGSQAIDLYGGAGTIGLAVAKVAAAVTGVEVSPSAVELAARNATAAGLANYRSVTAAAERLEPTMLASADTIIVDPPRAGLHPKLVAQVRATRPRRLIYLSCNPVTQARDLAYLTDLYRAGTVQGFDFYPGALHVESLVILDLI